MSTHPAVKNGAYDVARVRQDFPALAMQVYGKPLVYLDNAASAQKPSAVLDETDSGLDIDALNTVAEGVNAVSAETGMGTLIITHYQRILHIVKPQFVHIMFEGRIVKEGGPELVDQLEERGYGWIKEEVAAAA
jgi:Fe-S cluster assembly ATPase SufC